MLSIFILFMLDLCLADQTFSCCNQTCLVKGCQGETDALRPCLLLPPAVQAPLPLQATPAVGQPQAEGKPRRCAACGTVSPDRPRWKETFPAGRNICPAAGPHRWGGCSSSQHNTEGLDREKSHLCTISVQILLSKHVLVLLFWLCNIQADHAQMIFHPA